MRIYKWSDKNSMISSISIILSLSVILFLLTSCPSPISNSIVSQKKDEGAPTITITSPTDGDFYTELVTIKGYVSDDSATGGEIGEIRILSYEIIGPLGTIVSSELIFSSDGSFTFQFATANIDGSAVVKITATDWNENVGEYSITLKDPGNDIPSFTVKADNQEVKLSWDSVPNATGYTVHYTTNGTPPSINYGKKIQNISQAYSASSPLVIDELKNGNMHVFLLQAHSSNPSDLWLSNNEKAIPLSPLTLAPQITGEFSQIKIEWNSIPATEQFEVMRATESDGDYINISGIIETTSLIDDTVDEGQVYFYKVKPSFTGSIESDANCDETSPFTFAEGIELIGFGSAPGPGWAVEVDGNFAYVGHYSSEIQKVDITDPLNPVLMQSNFVGPPINDIEIIGNYAYLATSGGLYVLDTNTLSTVAFRGMNAWGVELDITNNEAYVAAFTVVNKFNVINPANPIPAGTIPISYASDVALTTDYVYVTDYNSADLWVLQKNPFQNLGPVPSSFPNERISVDGNYAVLTGVYGLAVMNISVPTAPVFEGQYLSGNFYGVGVELVGTKAYVANKFNQLLVISLFDPFNPFPTAFTDLPGWGQGVAVSGSYAYVADYFTGLDVVDISTSTPDNPSIEYSFPAGDARAIDVAGNFAYVANGSSGLQVLDISIPDNISDAGSASLSGIAVDVAVSGSHAFIAMEDDPATPSVDEGGLQIVDLTDLSSEGSFTTPGNAVGIALSGDYAYVADDAGGLQIIDISFTDDPKRVGFRETSGGDTNSVAMRGNYAFVTDGSGGFYAVDVSVPQNPRIAQTYQALDNFNDVMLSGNFAFVANASSSSLEAIDISFPNNLVPGNQVTTPGEPLSIAISGNYAFVADGTGGGSGGLEAIDISDPGMPTRIGTLDMSPGSAVDVAVTGDYAFVVDSFDGSIKSVDLLPTN